MVKVDIREDWETDRRRIIEAGTVWTPETNVAVERLLWASILEEQISAGARVDADWDSIDAVIDTRWDVDLDSIRRREMVTRHDLKARLEETLEVAQIDEILHLGCTSADIVENSYTIRQQLALDYLLELGASTTGCRLVFRGIKGPVGTQLDQLDLLGSMSAVMRMDQRVAATFGFTEVANSVPQVMYRSQDLAWGTEILVRVNWSEVGRAMATGYLGMLAGIAGTTWNEGDVSTSVVRRYAMPGLTELAAVEQTRSNQ